MSPLAAQAPGLGAALLAGLLSFLSPCVLPLVPGYLSFVSGYGLSDLRAGKDRARILWRSLAFAGGFSLVFAALGIVFSGGAMLLGGASRWLSVASGVVVALLGLNLLFDLLKVLNLEARFHPSKAPAGPAGAFVLGLAFGAGWSPCVGPVLASILLLAAREGSLAKSALLLGAYSLGLALPFVAAGLFLERLTPLMAWFKRRAHAVRIASGLLLLALGAFMALGRLAAVSALAARAGFALKEALVASPDALRLGAAAAWALLAALVLALPALRKKPVLTAPRIAFAALFALAAAAEASGLLSTARLLSEWLLYSGG